MMIWIPLLGQSLSPTLPFPQLLLRRESFDLIFSLSLPLSQFLSAFIPPCFSLEILVPLPSCGSTCKGALWAARLSSVSHSLQLPFQTSTDL